jgi:hypothetical protein
MRALRAVAYTTNELPVRDSPSAARDDEALSLEFGVGLLEDQGGGKRRNYVFIKHFQEIAQDHFTVPRLERVYGKDVVRTEYERPAEATELQAKA